jgi:hypothetical protein
MKYLILPALLFLISFSGYSQEKKTIENKFQAEIKFEEESYDFGIIKQGESVTKEFRFKNIGDSILVLTDVKASCGCTVPEWPKGMIQPGESGIIKITFNSQGKMGRFNKVVTIFSNSKMKIMYLRISGNIETAPPKPQK